MKKPLETIYMTIDNFMQGVKKMSLVKLPAIQEDWVNLEDEKINITLSAIDTEKRLITGPALIPEKLIYRFNEKTNEEYNIAFSEQTVQKIAEKFLTEARVGEVTLDHMFDIEGVTLVESWWTKSNTVDKAVELGYDVPVGTWMTTFRVDNDEILEAVQNGDVRGFSIEGSFAAHFAELAQSEITEEQYEEEIYQEVENILNSDINDDAKKTAIEQILGS